MKKIKILAAGLIAAAALSGCGGKVTTESLLKDANEKTSKAESLQMSMTMDLQANIAITGLSMDLGMNMELDADVINEPALMHAKGNVAIEMLGQSEKVDLEMYSEQDGNKSIVYSKSDDSGWVREENDKVTDIAQLYSADDIPNMVEVLELAAETETINRIECYKLSGEISGDQMQGLFDTMMESMNDNDMMSDFSFGDSNIPIEYYIAKADKYPVKMTVDMKDIMEKALKDSMGDSFQESMGLGEDVSVEIGVENCLVEVQFLSFDSVSEIKIPEEAKSAQEAAATEVSADDALTTQEISDIFAQNAEENETVADLPETEAETESKGKKTVPGNGEGWKDFSFELEGKSLSLPCSLEDLKAAGFEVDAEYTNVGEDYIINPNEYEYATVKYNGEWDSYLTVYFVNDSSEAKKVSECQVGGIACSSYDSEYKMQFELVFAGGITVGSTMDEVIAVYGEPTEKYEDDDYSSYEWRDRNYYNCGREVMTDENGRVISMQVMNIDIEY